MTPQEIEALFTRTDGNYAFARWGRPVAPVVFGVEDRTLAVIKGAFEAVARLIGQDIAETDPELGSNCIVFFLREWDELSGVPDLERLMPGLDALIDRLKGEAANQYRMFRFDDNGAIRAAFVFLRMDEHLSEMPAETLALSQVVQIVLAWSDGAFRTRSPLAVMGGVTVLHPEIAGLIHAAYDPALPDSAREKSHALRLFARQEHVE